MVKDQDYLKKTASYCIDLAKKLGDSQITVLNEKLDNFEVTLQKHQEILLKNKKASSVIMWLMAITLGLLTFTIFMN